MPGTRTRERGELETQIMRVLWNAEAPLSARDIQTSFEADHDDALDGPTPAYTTIVTVLGRLEKKGAVQREATSPRKVRYRATRSQEEQASKQMLAALDRVADREVALMQFAGNLDGDDLDFLRRALDGGGAATR
jgi:predicted transcriptional regulator